MSQKTLQNRIANIKQLLKKKKCDMVFLPHPVDLLYCTERNFSKGYLLITQQSCHLFLDGRYINSVKTDLYHVHPLQQFHIPSKKECSILFDSSISYDDYQMVKKAARKKEATCHLTAVYGLSQSLRSTKTNAEIKQIQKASDIGEMGFAFCLPYLKEGVQEKEIASLLKLYFLQQHGVDPSFAPIVAFGKNGANPHHHPSSTRLKKGELILMDLGCQFEGYCSDMTKMAILGKPNKQQVQLFDVVKKSQQAALSLCMPGQSLKKIYQTSCDILQKEGYELIHGLGHGVGLEIHEYPILSASSTGVLEAGMVITLEPGVYLPNWGGIRIEDLLLITKDGARLFTKQQKSIRILS